VIDTDLVQVNEVVQETFRLSNIFINLIFTVAYFSGI
jgi:hypothetical protein